MYKVTEQTCKRSCRWPANNIGVYYKWPVTCMATRQSCNWQVINHAKNRTIDSYKRPPKNDYNKQQATRLFNAWSYWGLLYFSCSKAVLFLQVPVESLWQWKRACIAPLHPAVEETLMGSHMFPRGLNDPENLGADGTCKLFHCWRWTMFSFKVCHQCLLGCITLVHSWHQWPFFWPQLFTCKSCLTLEARTLPHWSQDQPVSPVCVFTWWQREQVFLKLWWHSSQSVSPAFTIGTSKGTSSWVAPVDVRTFFPARMSFKIPCALFRSFFGTLIIPSSSGTAGLGCGGSGGDDLFHLLVTPRISSIPSASSSELTPTASGSSVSSGWPALYTEFSRGLQVKTSFTSSLLARTEGRHTSNQ